VHIYTTLKFLTLQGALYKYDISRLRVNTLTVHLLLYFNHNQLMQICRGINYTKIVVMYKGECKGKAIPLQALTGPEGSRRLRLPDFKIVGR
jgi:hypothetical protein